MKLAQEGGRYALTQHLNITAGNYDIMYDLYTSIHITCVIVALKTVVGSQETSRYTMKARKWETTSDSWQSLKHTFTNSIKGNNITHAGCVTCKTTVCVYKPLFTGLLAMHFYGGEHFEPGKLFN